MTLLQKRDAILESMRAQLLCKVSALVMKDQSVVTVGDSGLEKLLLDIANNATQAIADDEPEPTIFYTTTEAHA